MARHQVLQHSLVSCTLAIPHPFCQRHPRSNSVRHLPQTGPAPPRAGLLSPVAACPGTDDRPARPVSPSPGAADARLILDLNDPQTKHLLYIHRQVLPHHGPPSETLRESLVASPIAKRPGGTAPVATGPAPRSPALGAAHAYARLILDLDDPPTKHLHPSTGSLTPCLSIRIAPPRWNNSNTSVDKAITMHHHDPGQLHPSDMPFGHVPSTRCVSSLTHTLVASSTLTLAPLPLANEAGG